MTVTECRKLSLCFFFLLTNISIAFQSSFIIQSELNRENRELTAQSDTQAVKPIISHDPMTIAPPPTERIEVSFSHIQIYVDTVEELDTYKRLEERLNQFETSGQQRSDWEALEIVGQDPPQSDYIPQNRDLVRQLITCGWRVTGLHETAATRSVLLTSKDPQGAQFLVTALQSESKTNGDEHDAFSENAWRKFTESNAGRQGIGVLAFRSPSVNQIRERYKSQHPALLSQSYQIKGRDTLEVYAYYQNGEQAADEGTVLRFVQADDLPLDQPLPGMKLVEATFSSSCQAAYCDHWVSNVFDRNQFLDTLHDTLGFTPKVDFNAGVVAAGEAQIESTVTGNNPVVEINDPGTALRDQSQVYLPINNALSDVGHVNGFLKELGQGVQHIASRVDDLVAFVQRANEMREITGEGMSFLRIPRSYYGILRPDDLVRSGISTMCAESLIDILKTQGLMTADAAVSLAVEYDELDSVLTNGLAANKEYLNEYKSHQQEVLRNILFSRYSNLYSLLRDQVGEETYLGIVRNQILVDIQGNDLLYQIFTSNILQREPSQESPFLEFIQRVCSKESGGLRPGCGGFGIRNFLTLFLSIEVSKAMNEHESAKQEGDDRKAKYAMDMVDCFTEQLNDSNPILTDISNAMTEEGVCKAELEKVGTEDAEPLLLRMRLAAEKKQDGNDRLMHCSSKFNDRMKALKEDYLAT